MALAGHPRSCETRLWRGTFIKLFDSMERRGDHDQSSAGLFFEKKKSEHISRLKIENTRLQLTRGEEERKHKELKRKGEN